MNLHRKENETWREVAIRIASSHGLELEVIDVFDRLVADGKDEADAAWEACYSWDVLPYTGDAS